MDRFIAIASLALCLVACGKAEQDSQVAAPAAPTNIKVRVCWYDDAPDCFSCIDEPMTRCATRDSNGCVIHTIQVGFPARHFCDDSKVEI